MSKNYHVTPHPHGGWQVKGEKNQRATAITNTQTQAIKIAMDKITNIRLRLFKTFMTSPSFWYIITQNYEQVNQFFKSSPNR